VSKGPAGERVLIMMMMKATTSARLRQRKCGRSLRASTLRDKFSVKSMHAEDVRLGATETAAVASRRGEEEATSSSSTPSSAHPSRLFGKGTTRRERRRGGELDGLIAAYAPPRPPPSTAVALDPALLPADMTQDCLADEALPHELQWLARFVDSFHEGDGFFAQVWRYQGIK